MSETTPEPVSDLDKLPNKLSPSRAKMFENCPKSFYFRTIKKLPTKNTVANTRGTLAHEALEEIFKLPREERTPEKAHEFVEPAWRKIENRDSYKDMVEPGSDEEKEMLEYAKQMVTNAFKIENIRGFDAGALEYHAEADINGLTLHGYIDRLDEAPVNGEPRAFISDYKALAIDTPIPTPTGWTSMGDVQVGDQVLGSDGNATRVTKKSRVHPNRPCFEITVDGWDAIIADEDHLWVVAYTEHGARVQATVTTAKLAELMEDRAAVEVRAADKPASTREPVGKYHQITSVKPTESVDTQCIGVEAEDSLFLVGRSAVPTHNTGKIPRDRYLDDAFFAMRIYALLLFEETGKMPHMLRLIYLKGETAEEAVRRVIVTPELLERTRRDVNAIWRRIKTAAATGNWPTKTGPLCNFCDFKPMCPAFGGEG